MTFRDLRADEIDVRVQSVSEKGAVLLFYKDARVDMNILDETVQPENWQRSHEVVDGVLYCNVGINVATNGEAPRWVWKQDCGTESTTEKEKGRASDSFKRACFNWGIGRELYTAPFTFVKAADCNIKDNNGKKVCYDKFSVEKIVIENKTIKAVAVRNDTTGKRVFVWQESPSQKPAGA